MHFFSNLAHKKLIIHAGGSRTGSSFLQKKLANNPLKKYGVNYASVINIDNVYPEGGNGQCIYEILNSPDAGQSEKKRIIELIKGFFQESCIAICSSEFLSELSPEQWRLFITILDDLKIDYKIIVFIRDVSSYFASVYLQSVLYHGVASSISHWIEAIDKWQHA